jgi:hypothetical protein
MKKQFITMGSLAAAALLVLASCKKNNTETIVPQPDSKVEQLKLALQTNLGFIQSFANGVANKDKNRTGGRDGSETMATPTNPCPAFGLSLDTTGGWGFALAFDFGTGCPNDIALGIIRRGKVTYKYMLTNNLSNQIGVLYQNYEDGPTTFNGVFKSAYQYTALGHNYFLGADSLRFTNVAWGSSVYQTALEYKQQQGIATPFLPADDVYHITGTTTTVNNVLGLSRFEVLTPLVNKLNCNWLVSGRVKITLGTAIGIVDFGNGTCDNVGTLETGGLVFPISF